MGQLNDPMEREKYSRADLIKIVKQYDELQKEIDECDISLRETTFTIEPFRKEELDKQKKALEERKTKLYSEKKMRHTIICGIPCNYVNESFRNQIGKKFEDQSTAEDKESMEKIEEQSKEDEESLLNNSAKTDKSMENVGSMDKVGSFKVPPIN